MTYKNDFSFVFVTYNIGYNGNTALHCSGAQDHVLVVQLLLEAEARTDIMNDDMLTPAMLSAQEGNLECLHFMLSCDNNCAQRNQLGKKV